MSRERMSVVLQNWNGEESKLLHKGRRDFLCSKYAQLQRQHGVFRRTSPESIIPKTSPEVLELPPTRPDTVGQPWYRRSCGPGAGGGTTTGSLEQLSPKLGFGVSPRSPIVQRWFVSSVRSGWTPSGPTSHPCGGG